MILLFKKATMAGSNLTIQYTKSKLKFLLYILFHFFFPSFFLLGKKIFNKTKTETKTLNKTSLNYSNQIMKEFPKNQNIQAPCHFELLSQTDIKDYIIMRNNFSVEVNKSKKGERRESFINTLKIIRSYIERNDADDCKRSLVCGVIFLNGENSIFCEKFSLEVQESIASLHLLIQLLM